MLSAKTIQSLINLLLNLAENERQIEVLRQILCEQETFEPYAAFKRIDRSCKNSITVQDISKFLSDNKISRDTTEIAAFLRRYDTDFDNRLVYTEFIQIVLPITNRELRAIATQRPNYLVSSNQCLPYETEHALTKVIDREISFFSALNEQKIELTQCSDFSYLEAFMLIDVDHSGRINFRNLYDFFNNHDTYPSDDEIKAVLKRLNKSRDGQVPYEDFIGTIEPLNLISKSINTAKKSKLVESVTKEEEKKTSDGETKIPKKDNTELNHNSKESSKVAPNSFREMTNKPIVSTEPVSMHKEKNSLSQSTNTLGKDFNKIDWRTNLSPQGDKKDLIEPRAYNSFSSGDLDKYTRIFASADRLARVFGSTLSYGNNSGSKQFESRDETGLMERLEAEMDRNWTPPTKTDTVKHPDTASPRYYDKSTSLRNLPGTYSDVLKSNKYSSPSLDDIGSGLKNGKNEDKKDKAVLIIDNNQDEKEVKKTLDFANMDECKAVVDMLNHFIRMDKEAESAKKELSERLDFSMLELFKNFNGYNRGLISKTEIKEGMKKFGIYPDRRELYLFIKRFEGEDPGEFKFSDFVKIFKPKQDLSLNLVPRKRASSRRNAQPFIEGTRKAISRILTLLLQNEKTAEHLRFTLSINESFNYRGVFRYIDDTQDGYLDAKKIRKVFEAHEIVLNVKDLDLLMERFNPSDEGRISYLTFMREIMPKAQKDV